MSIKQLIDLSDLVSRHCILIFPIFCTVAVVDSSTLTFHRVTRQHMGSYLCIASNGVPPTVSKRITLIVHCMSSTFKNNLYIDHNIYYIGPTQLICTYNYSRYFSVAPMVWIQNQLVGAFVGDRLSIECHVEAFPKSINYWSSENGNLLTQGRYTTNNIIQYSHIGKF